MNKEAFVGLVERLSRRATLLALLLVGAGLTSAVSTWTDKPWWTICYRIILTKNRRT